jgi:hypothetical protein
MGVKTVILLIVLLTIVGLFEWYGGQLANESTAKHCDREGVLQLDGTLYECHAVKVTTGD